MKHLLPKKLLCWGFFTVFIKSFPFYEPCPSSALPSNGFFADNFVQNFPKMSSIKTIHAPIDKKGRICWVKFFCFNILHASASGSGILQHHWYNFNDFFGEEEIINGGWWYEATVSECVWNIIFSHGLWTVTRELKKTRQALCQNNTYKNGFSKSILCVYY